MAVEFDRTLYAGWVFRPRKGQTQLFVPSAIADGSVSGVIVTLSPHRDESGWAMLEVRPVSISESEIGDYALLSWDRVTDILDSAFSEFERMVRALMHGDVSTGTAPTEGGDE